MYIHTDMRYRFKGLLEALTTDIARLPSRIAKPEIRPKPAIHEVRVAWTRKHMWGRCGSYRDTPCLAGCSRRGGSQNLGQAEMWTQSFGRKRWRWHINPRHGPKIAQARGHVSATGLRGAPPLPAGMRSGAKLAILWLGSYERHQAAW